MNDLTFEEAREFIKENHWEITDEVKEPNWSLTAETPQGVRLSIDESLESPLNNIFVKGPLQNITNIEQYDHAKEKVTSPIHLSAKGPDGIILRVTHTPNNPLPERKAIEQLLKKEEPVGIRFTAEFSFQNTQLSEIKDVIKQISNLSEDLT